MFIPLENPPDWIDIVGGIFPVRPFADATLASFFAPTGTGFQGGDLMAVAAWRVAGVVLAARFFTWEPHI